MKTGRAALRTLVTGACAVGLAVGLQGQAWAGTVTIYAPGDAGSATWNQDPSGSTPGDAIRACDTKSDGWGIEAALDYNYDGVIDRYVDTRGHNAGYCSPWKGGDLPEGKSVRMYVTPVKGGSYGPSTYIDVAA
ncbi:hypothetical protein ACIO8H_02780 [Streptomyces sp. NPDC087226]|uniref:hypothetical protein n=1 Tax=Streptomyces sp. NPDC087226 TaxID=3365771 RepID=UPI003802A001